MANCSIPNSSLANGRISTRSLRQSRRRNNPAAGFDALRLTGIAGFNLSRLSNAQRSIHKVRLSMLDIGSWKFSFSRRVKGAWWSSRSSKLSSPRKWRDRFDSYPLRQIFSCHPEQIPRTRENSKDPVAISKAESSGFLDFARNDKLIKGGEPDVA